MSMQQLAAHAVRGLPRRRPRRKREPESPESLGGSVVCDVCSNLLTDQETTLTRRALAALGCYVHRRDGVSANTMVREMLAARANVETPGALAVCLECVVRAIGLIAPGAEVRPHRDAATSW